MRGRGFSDGRRARRPQASHALLCAITLVLGAPIGLFFLYAQPTAAPGLDPVREAQTDASAARRVARADARRSATRHTVHVALLDPNFTAGYNPLAFSATLPSASDLDTAAIPDAPDSASSEPASSGSASSGSASSEPASPEPTSREPEAPVADAAPTIVLPVPPVSEPLAAVPLPMRRPASLAREPGVAPPPPSARRAPRAATASAGTAATAGSFFARLFGPSQPPESAALAYAAPEDGTFGSSAFRRPSIVDAGTAVYNIATHTVTLPSGAQLEAHSGLGARLDDPRSVTEHMRGATPPNIYELTPRETLFHGVRALRLTPTGGTTYGRGGLLAHTYMLGPRGDSNGCVVFKNYGAFLQAFDSGAVRRLVVVTGTT